MYLLQIVPAACFLYTFKRQRTKIGEAGDSEVGGVKSNLPHVIGPPRSITEGTGKRTTVWN